MNISLLKCYDLNKTSLSQYRLQNPEGMSLAEILDLENTLNKGVAFPKAFREYLFIGGKFNSIGLNDGLGNFKGMDTYYKKKGKRERINNKPTVSDN
jgi:hypothetical protein